MNPYEKDRIFDKVFKNITFNFSNFFQLSVHFSKQYRLFIYIKNMYISMHIGCGTKH